MQAVLDFLLQYYVWVLAVLLILLITVIGFLADTKKKKRMREMAMASDSMINNSTNNTPVDFNGINQNQNVSMGTSQSSVFEPVMTTDLNNNMLNNQFVNNDVNASSNNMVNDSINSNLNMMNNQNNLSDRNINVVNDNATGMINNQNANNMVNGNMTNGDINNMSNYYSDSVNSNPNIIGNQNPMNGFNNNGNGDSFFVPTLGQTSSVEPVDVSIPRPVMESPRGFNQEPVMNDKPLERPSVNFQAVANQMPEISSLSTTSLVNITSNNRTVNPIPNSMGSVPVSPIPEPVNIVPEHIVNGNINSNMNYGGSIPNSGFNVPNYVANNQVNMNNNTNMNNQQ